ncbi:DUF6090 family protein [Maribacter arcticus]|uniref:Uncharacterized protein n=1 Tax=Maribacter arcticus TaxID=561365 RepID=A0A1T5D715_9FLAO|nr:DUF6090 family protein [Maribacter arcticus]SKB67313.1 hypothetical protein SAMN05660866_02770 [Maribacter arcticus]|tara:strand:+ start:28 stop:786 length:759 start_codon:yes stop_codon:yes gene_type:complete
MIKFFRKIRQRLLTDNKFSKYVLYAIGEIVLVVIGILIALQINNWNEEQKNKVIEQQLLTSLLLELETNLTILTATIETNTEIIKNCITIGKFTGPSLPVLSEKELSQNMVGAFKYASRYIPNQGTYNEINNSGKLSIISDPSLRKAISELQSQLELVKIQENAVTERGAYTHQFFINNGNFRRHLDIIEDALIAVEPSRFPNNDFTFLEKPEFESNLYIFIVMSINLNKNFYLPLEEQSKRLIAQIRQNIE